MESFLNCEEFSDVAVKVGTKDFKCHKIVLASWSSYFRGLFTSGMTEVQQGAVELTTIEKAEFQDMLKIMYTGECEVNKDNVQGILYAASYLQMIAVEDECVELILKTLRDSMQQNFQYLKIGRLLNLKKLTNRIIDFIARKFQEYKLYDGIWSSLTVEDMKDLLVSPNLRCTSEDEICAVIFRWIDEDAEDRGQYVNDLLSRLRYLALTNDYMKEIFLKHPVVKDNPELQDIRCKCLEYLSKPRQQFEYIGETILASHRPNHNLANVIVVCYPTYISCISYTEVNDGTFTVSKPQTVSNAKEDDEKFKNFRQTYISACNYGRSEILLSTGRKLYHFNGLTGIWTPGPEHLIHSESNCLLYDPKADYIYSVLVNRAMIFIEKCRFNSEHDSGAWHIEVQQQNETWSGICQEDEPAPRTCAYLIDDNVFFLITDTESNSSGDAIYRYNTVTKSMEFVARLPPMITCSVAVPYKDFVFLVDCTATNILRVSENGFCVEEYGEIDHDVYTVPEKEGFVKDKFGACIYKDRLVLAGCSRRVRNRCFVDYDLNAHITTCYAYRPQFEAAVCLRMTISPRGLFGIDKTDLFAKLRV